MFQVQSIQLTETGRRLGHDLYRFRNRLALKEKLPASVREGFEFASATGVRPQIPDRYVKKWLQLRMSAWHRGRAFDEGVTPEMIRSMDVVNCPITRVALTHGERASSDWSVDRVNNDGAYAANNLAVMSTLANRAKGALGFDEVLALSTCSSPTAGLTPAEWLRMASLMLGPCFATKPQEVPALPLVAPIAPCAVRLTMQQVQHVFTTRANTQAGKNMLIKVFKFAARTERSESRLRVMAEAIHVGLKRVDHAHDVWLADGVMGSLERWHESLDADAWARAGEVSRRLAGSRVLPQSGLQAWSLSSRGYVF